MVCSAFAPASNTCSANPRSTDGLIPVTGSARTCTSRSGSASRVATSWSKRSTRGAKLPPSSLTVSRMLMSLCLQCSFSALVRRGRDAAFQGQAGGGCCCESGSDGVRDCHARGNRHGHRRRRCHKGRGDEGDGKGGDGRVFQAGVGEGEQGHPGGGGGGERVQNICMTRVGIFYGLGFGPQYVRSNTLYFRR